jgi:hypothetical protein
MVKLVLASRNRKKIRELETLLADLSSYIQVLSLDDIGYTGDIVEDGETFAANSKIKASVPASMGCIGIADDSGLCVDALNGAPGVYSARYSGEGANDAKNNAKLNGIINAEFFVGKAEEVLPEFYENLKEGDAMLTPDVIVVDPPRKGCDTACLDTMLKMQPKRIVYVSCDSATLARDLRILCDGGYEVKKVRAFDQFAHTGHVESVVMLSRTGGTTRAL